MKIAALIGIALCFVGLLSFVYLGLTHAPLEDAMDLGVPQMMAEQTDAMPFSSIFGSLALVSGTVLVVVNSAGFVRRSPDLRD